jgi:hypothetical protein
VSDAHAEGDEHTPVGPVALIVGPGDRFLYGVSYDTTLLTSALAERGPVAMLLLRRLCPRAVYPGRARVGSTDGALPLPEVPVFNGLDWFWGSSALGALAEGIRWALPLVDRVHADPHSWPQNADRYAALLDRIDTARSRDGRVSGDRAKEVVA